MSADHVTAACESGETARSQRPTCAAPSCWSDAETVRVGDREAVLCETCRRTYLGVSS